jgi:hypothetical protein
VLASRLVAILENDTLKSGETVLGHIGLSPANQTRKRLLLLHLSALARGLASLSPSRLESCDRSPALQSGQRRQPRGRFRARNSGEGMLHPLPGKAVPADARSLRLHHCTPDVHGQRSKLREYFPPHFPGCDALTCNLTMAAIEGIFWG